MGLLGLNLHVYSRASIDRALILTRPSLSHSLSLSFSLSLSRSFSLCKNKSAGVFTNTYLENVKLTLLWRLLKCVSCTRPERITRSKPLRQTLSVRHDVTFDNHHRETRRRRSRVTRKTKERWRISAQTNEYKANEGQNGREPRRTRPDGWRVPRTVLVARSERDTAANDPHCAADGDTLSVAARAMPRKYEGTPRRVEGERPAGAACLRNSIATVFESRRRERQG